MGYAYQRITRTSKTHRNSNAPVKGKNTSIKRTASRRNKNATAKRTATRIK